ncbi:MAG: tRNA (adenosine(37)-N6)-threonylcarbamoyltransferase complex transferase subunit TsaD [Deltaproteobacteria bacterium]|nr:tRNA (adenosine(37)-N6)-threonylcarbamoyltransferase complex transferase subunit TsaD [Deltaproteobacteria bacterium]MBW2530828.1 tRNA (adenosine(37)-N6)-threonylcarbamoyltransferase complex transferase subunit TsaD [Deltaproteobacteria bacterium]
MRVLGIESSCDETAAAVVSSDGTVCSDVVRSQVAAHAPYGGVVPEIAARDHLRAGSAVVRRALVDAALGLTDVDGIAVTCRPGLIGALLVGVQLAKGLAWAADRPLVGVDHLVGHLLSVHLDPSTDGSEGPTFPYVGLLVSGGHTALYRCDGPLPSQMHELGATRDDAVGEAFDKVAKLLGLGYPGGPIIDQLAARGEAGRATVTLRAPMARRDSLEFSFSGLKSAVARHVASHGAPADERARADLCAAFQEVVTRTLVTKALRATRDLGMDTLVVAGGVAANRGLRDRMTAACDRRGVRLFIPPIRRCTDNAAMIAYAGAQRLAAGERDPLDLGPSTRTSLPQVTRKGRGRR